MASHGDTEIHALAARIVQAIAEDSDVYPSTRQQIRLRDEIRAALELLTQAAGESREAAGIIEDYFYDFSRSGAWRGE